MCNWNLQISILEYIRGKRSVKEPRSYGRKEKGRTIRPADCERIPELKEYLRELCDLTKSIKDEESSQEFLRKYGKHPKRKINRDIKSILNRGNYNRVEA